MCGIAGIVNFNADHAVERDVVSQMTGLLAHRGPDARGVHVDKNVGLGHRRLSVLDLSRDANQPMPSDDRTVWITYNGEVYNFRELRASLEKGGCRFRTASDTEVVLRLYLSEGLDFVQHLTGMFAIAIWDGRNQTLVLARDRIGIKPLYYHLGKDHISFASEMKALLAEPRTPTGLDDVALSDYLHLMSIPDPHSILAGVRKLSPGHIATVCRGDFRQRAYWTIPLPSEPTEVSLESACDHFEELFTQAVHSHLVSDVPVGAFLSGGVDSSAVVALMGREMTAGMYTFSTAFRGLDTFDESVFAREVATLFGTRHCEINLDEHAADALPAIAWHCDEPFAVSSALALYSLSRRAREDVKVVLTGDGGDEVFAGYTWKHVEFPALPARLPERLHGPVRQVLRTAARAVPGWFRSGRLANLVRSDERYIQSFVCFSDAELRNLVRADIWPALERAWLNNVTQHYFDESRRQDQLTRKLYTDMRSTLVSEMLTKVDRMTMAFGLEARVPFLDHRLVEWAFSLPADLKMHGTEGKYVVKRSVERVLPHRILYRPKHGFNVPLGRWLRGGLKDLAHDLLGVDSVRRRGLLDPQAVQRLLKDHDSGRDDIGNRIYVLMMLELWWREVLDRRPTLLRRAA